MRTTKFLRERLAVFIKDHRTIKQFEDLSFDVAETIPADVEAVEGLLASGQVQLATLLGIIGRQERRIRALETLVSAQVH